MKVGFLVHQTRVDPENSKERLVEKFPFLKPLPAWFIHNHVMPRLPVRKLRMGDIRDIDSISSNAYTDIVFWGESRDPDQMVRDQRIDRLVKAAKKCADEGAQLIGLGAFTAIIGPEGGGIEIANALNKQGVWVTTGNSLTAGSGVQGTLALAEEAGYDHPSRLTAAVIGANGSTGQVVAQLLAEVVDHVLIVGRKGHDLSELRQKIGPKKAEQTTLVEALRRSQLVITVTNATEALDFEPALISQGAIICDIARPRDIAEIVTKCRSDVLVFDGPILNIPGFGSDLKTDFECELEEGTTYPCMAETMVLGLEDWPSNFSLGKVLDLDQTKNITRLAREHGFTRAGFRSFDRPISPEMIANFGNKIPKEYRYG